MKTGDKTLSILLLAVMILVPACSPRPVNDLEGTSWNLVSYGPAGAEITAAEGKTTMTFDKRNQVSGKAGCNSYGGSYEINGKTITFRNVNSTLMACVDEALMKQETDFLTALQTTGEYELSGDKLVIADKSGSGRLTFQKTTSLLGATP